MHPVNFPVEAECDFAERFSANEAAEIYAAVESIEKDLCRSFRLTARELTEAAHEKRDPETWCKLPRPIPCDTAWPN